MVDLSGDGGGILLHQLKRGRTIQGLRLEPGGLDEDDDLAVFEFAEDDPAVRPLRLSRAPDADSPPATAPNPESPKGA